MAKAVVAGHICLDLTPKFPYSTNLSDIKPGSLLFMDGLEVSTGGAVANTGLAMQFFGADVTAVSVVGKDYLGGIVADIFKKHNIKTRLKTTDKENTSYSVVIAPKQSDRVFLHCPGTNNVFTSNDVDLNLLKDADLFHFGYPPLMNKMHENDGAELTKLFISVKSTGVTTSLDMAMFDTNSEAAKTDWKKLLKNTLPYVDIFVPSYDELCLMLGEKTPEALAAEVVQMGVKICLIKCGSKGFLVHTAEGLTGKFESWNAVSYFKESYKVDNVISATGAGDTCIAAFLTSFINGFTPSNCIDFAAAAGACCCERYDSLSGLQSFDEMRLRFKIGAA